MNDPVLALLDLLRRHDGPLSGEEAGRALHITRSAISKHIATLRRRGYDIESGPRRGHRLRSGTDAPRAEEVLPLLATKAIGRVLRYFDTVESTNAVAATEALAGAPEGMVVTADAQTAGRGRQHRTWCSPAGCNLYFSLVLRPRVLPRRVPQISLVAAAAVHQALADVCPSLDLKIKWPNDILDPSGRKLCGILCEGDLEADSVHHVIVGVGLNVNMQKIPPELRRIATSLSILEGRKVSRPALLAAILNRFEAAYARWQRSPSLTPLLPYLERHSFLAGQNVRVENIAGRLEGRAEGMTAEGALKLRTAAGRIETVEAGDVLLCRKPGDKR
jgi:BirA family transcriptional regulator, biotin operon repressor / biotin---[acetyl-CoA-carboxylase] ligase